MAMQAMRRRLSSTGLSPVSAAALAGGLLLWLVVFPLLWAGENYALTVAVNTALLSFISLGVWLTFAIGRINISQGAFALVGGYAAAIFMTRWELSFWLALPLSGLVAAGVGALIGLPVLRLRGVYCAMVTLCLTKAANLVFLNGGDFTGGARGITGIPRPGELSLFGLTVVPDFAGRGALPFFFLSAALLLAGLALVWRIWRSRLGRIFRCMRQNEELARSLGVNVVFYRTFAYALSCGFGGVGGAVFAAFQQNVFPSTYTVNDSVYFMLYCFLGGLDFVLGAVAGAALLVVSFELLHGLEQYQVIIYGALMIGVMLVLPNGLLSLIPRFGKTEPRAGGEEADDKVDEEVDGKVGDGKKVAASQPVAGMAQVDNATGAGGGELLRAEGVARRFGGLVAVNEVGFAVNEGEIVSVIGPNGAGKSTLFKLLCGFLRPNAGRVVFGGRDLAGIRPHQAARLGLVRTFQETTIFRDMTALECVTAAHHIRCRAGVWGILFNTARARADERAFEKSAAAILRRLGLGALRHEQAKNLPHGHLRALGIAAALATGPRALLLDEPLAGMNPEETDRMVAMIDGVRRDGVTILLVEHDMRAVMRISDRIVALNFGRKLAEGGPDAIRRNPEVIEAYLGKEDDEVGH